MSVFYISQLLGYTIGMYIAVDIGGTKTLICELDKSGKLLSKTRFETPKDYGEFIALFEKTFGGITLKSKPKYCVIGAPGKMDRERGIGVAFSNLPWEQVPLGKDIGRIIGVKAVIENDANLAGLSEAVLLKNKYRKVLYITVSTGIGGVLVINGKIDPELADTEFGTMMFEHQGRLQQWQEFASGKAIVKKFGQKASDITDPNAWYVIAHNIALGLTNVINTLTPEVVVIGGGVGTHFDKYKDRLREDIQLFGNNVVTIPEIVQAERAEDAVIYGCYELGRQQHAQ